MENPNVLDFVSSEITGLYRFIRILGISRRELEIYTLILTTGGLTANEISDILGIPLSKVYESLTNLINRKWVYKTADRPARYFSIPVRDVWEDIKKSVFNQFKEVEEKIIPLLENVSNAPEPLFRVVLLDYSRIFMFAQRIINKSKNKVAVVINYPELLNDSLLKDIVAASSRKQIRVLVDKNLHKSSKIKEFTEIIPIKTMDKLFGSGIIGDEILLVVKTGNLLQGLWSDHLYFVDLGWIYFNYLWNDTK